MRAGALMPRYDFQCGNCGRVYELTRTIAARNQHDRCRCGGVAIRQQAWGTNSMLHHTPGTYAHEHQTTRPQRVFRHGGA